MFDLSIFLSTEVSINALASLSIAEIVKQKKKTENIK